MIEGVYLTADEIKTFVDKINEAWENIDPITQNELYMMDGHSVAVYLNKVDDLLDFLSDKYNPEDQNDDGDEDIDVDDCKEFTDTIMTAIEVLPKGSTISHRIPRNSGRYPWGKE